MNSPQATEKSMTPDTFTIPSYRFADFVVRMDKLNRKAKRLGCLPAAYQVVGETTIKVESPADHETGKPTKFYEIPAKLVTVTGSAPQVGDHQLLARIEYLDDGLKSKLFHTVPGVDVKVDERFRALSPGVCEHCNKTRTRRDTFVVRNVIDGDQKQVGRNCLADFIGGRSPEAIANSASYLHLFEGLDSDGDNGFRGYFRDRVDTFDVLRLTSAYISLYGWVPKSQANEQFRSTSSRVWDHFGNQVHQTEWEKAEVIRVGELSNQVVHVERATKVIAWVKNDLAPAAKTDYELNLCTLVVGDLTESRHIGLVCSAVSAYERAMNRGIEYAKKKIEGAKSDFIGVKGDKFKGLPVSVQFVKTMAGTYGAITLVKFVDEKGNILTWFASGDKEFTPGEKLTISGTVKDQKEYQGIKETQLTRVKAT